MDEALDGFGQRRANVVITDIFMPGTNGLLGIAALRHRSPDLPVIAISAGVAGERAQDALAAARMAGADAVLSKPFEMDVLAAKIGEVIKERSGRTKVLVVDDSSTIRTVVKRCLEQQNYHVTVADSVEQAIEMPDLLRIDVLITDIFMPGVGGLAGLKLYRENWPTCKIIAMSAGFEDQMPMEIALQAASKIGVDGVLKKPFTGDELTKLVGELS